MSRRLFAGATMALFASACTSTVGTPQLSVRAVRAASAADVPAMAVGSFTATGQAAGSDRAVGLRADTIKPPAGGSFARYLGDTLAEQLRLSAKLDPAAPLILSGVLEENHANTDVGKAHGALVATFRLSRGTNLLFEKRLRVDAEWNSSFIAAAAVPEAERNYTALYPRLVEILLEDPDFRAAARAAHPA